MVLKPGRSGIEAFRQAAAVAALPQSVSVDLESANCSFGMGLLQGPAKANRLAREGPEALA